MDGSVIENCCGAVALVSHIWVMAKPLKHKTPTSSPRYRHEIQDSGFSKSSMRSISNQTRIPTNWDIQLTSSGHSQFLSHLLIFLRKQGGTPGWKGHYPPAFLAWQGGTGWVWNGGAGWGKKLHCKSRGGTLVGFGPFGFCWCFSSLSPLSPDLTWHSSWLCSEHVLQGKTRQHRQVFLNLVGNNRRWTAWSIPGPSRPKEPWAENCMTITALSKENICVLRKVTCVRKDVEVQYLTPE